MTTAPYRGRTLGGSHSFKMPDEKTRDEHGIDLLVAAMKRKLAAKRDQGRGGWWRPECEPVDLARMLREHLAKGDPVDIANFAMMLFNRADGPKALSEVFSDMHP